MLARCERTAASRDFLQAFAEGDSKGLDDLGEFMEETWRIRFSKRSWSPATWRMGWAWDEGRGWYTHLLNLCHVLWVFFGFQIPSCCSWLKYKLSVVYHEVRHPFICELQKRCNYIEIRRQGLEKQLHKGKHQASVSMFFFGMILYHHICSIALIFAIV